MIPMTPQFTLINADDVETDAIAINMAIELSVS